jgi:hypothetical protein
MTREQLENLVWTNKHPDFRGLLGRETLIEWHAAAIKDPEGEPHHLFLPACNCWMADGYTSRRHGVRSILRFTDAKGSELCALPLLSLGELVDSLPSKVRAHHGLVLWRLVLCPTSGTVLGRFGSALLEEARACMRQVSRETNVQPRLVLAAGRSIPGVGEVYDEKKHSTLESMKG